MSTESDCSICLEPLTAPRVAVQLSPCKHSSFCVSCVVKLCQDSPHGVIKCPLCRTPMREFEFLDGSGFYFEVKPKEPQRQETITRGRMMGPIDNGIGSSMMPHASLPILPYNTRADAVLEIIQAARETARRNSHRGDEENNVALAIDDDDEIPPLVDRDPILAAPAPSLVPYNAESSFNLPAAWAYYQPFPTSFSRALAYALCSMNQASANVNPDASISLEVQLDVVMCRIRNWNINPNPSPHGVRVTNGNRLFVLDSEGFFSGNPRGRFVFENQ